MRRANGFSLIELLVVIGIIAVLIGITIPTVSAVRRAGYDASTRSMVAGLAAAIQQYQLDFRSYPGPLSSIQTNNIPFYTGTEGVPNINGMKLQRAVYQGASYAAGAAIPGLPGYANPAGDASGDPNNNQISGTENLVLGLMGGLVYKVSPPAEFYYDDGDVGRGPQSLNPRNPKRYRAYLDATNLLSDGQFIDAAGRPAGDTIIPEFVDRSPDAMPVIYARANVGTTAPAARNWGTGWPARGQYDMDQIVPYTGMIGGPAGYGINLPNGKFHGLRYVNGSDPDMNGVPVEAKQFTGENYLQSGGNVGPVNAPVPQGTVRSKDGFVLIAAGKDRIYGTTDDIVSFGAVQ